MEALETAICASSAMPTLRLERLKRETPDPKMDPVPQTLLTRATFRPSLAQNGRSR